MKGIGNEKWKTVSVILCSIPALAGILLSLLFLVVSLLFSEWMGLSHALRMWLVLLVVPWSFGALEGLIYLASEYLSEPARLSLMLATSAFCGYLAVHFTEFQSFVDSTLKSIIG